ncbi:MAG: hypothetical protein ACTSPG_05420 [Candidatus Hodarchaeales archaeon]
MEIETRHEKFERYVVSATAFICAVALALLSFLGPSGLQLIIYRTSQSVIYQIQGQDLVNVLFLAPICVIGGILHFRGNENSKYFLILVGLYISLYTGFAYGIGQEWSHPAYTGNVERFFLLFYVLVVGGLLLFISSFSMFKEEDAPDFNPKSLRIYIGLMTVFLILFSLMWVKEVIEVILTGNTLKGTYLDSPNVFWIIRYLDLGFTIPIGFIGLYLLGTRPKKAYPLILAFYGFFGTLGTAVLGMAVVMVLNGDPSVQGGALVIFPVLTILAWAGFFYLIKTKIHWLNKP